jgi:demethylmenaquinone methyltransferase/2-methoxy-6-polyprenyl-1,4-benzoquinol methylase
LKDGPRYEIDNARPEERKRFIRGMFDSLVPTYDLLNRLLSFGTDQLWRRSMVRMLGTMKGMNVLDLCCGTGDLSKVFHDMGARVVSLDFSMPMLRRGLAKKKLRGSPVAADASFLPFLDGSFDVLSIAFGIRNIPDLDRFLGEAARVMRIGGRMAVLELTRPEGPAASFFFRIYLRGLLPLIGGIVSGKGPAYRYLSGTVATFLDPGELCRMMEQKGLLCMEMKRRSFGASTIIICRKQPQGLPSV